LVVVLDSSYPMRADLARVRAVLNQIGSRRYTEYSLYTEKAIVHGWLPNLAADNVTFYAPRDWSRLTSLEKNPEFSEASNTILITNDPAPPNGSGDWSVIHLK
jgi:hypothetical protein